MNVGTKVEIYFRDAYRNYAFGQIVNDLREICYHLLICLLHLFSALGIEIFHTVSVSDTRS